MAIFLDVMEEGPDEGQGQDDSKEVTARYEVRGSSGTLVEDVRRLTALSPLGGQPCRNIGLDGCHTNNGILRVRLAALLFIDGCSTG